MSPDYTLSPQEELTTIGLELLSHMCHSCRASPLCCHLSLENLSHKLNDSPSQWAGHCPSIRAARSIVVWADPPEKPVRRGGGAAITIAPSSDVLKPVSSD